MAADGVFDLFGLHPDAADFHLAVDAPQQLEITVLQEPSQIAGAVEAVGGIRGHRIGNEAVLRHVRVIEVAEGAKRGADVDFPHPLLAAELHLFVEYE